MEIWILSLICVNVVFAQDGPFINDCNHQWILDHSKRYGHTYCSHSCAVYNDPSKFGLTTGVCAGDGFRDCKCGGSIDLNSLCPPKSTELMADEACRMKCKNVCKGEGRLCGEVEEVPKVNICNCLCPANSCPGPSPKPNTTSTEPPTTTSTEPPTTTSTEPPTTTSTELPNTTSTEPPTATSTEPPTATSTEPPTTTSTKPATTTKRPFIVSNKPTITWTNGMLYIQESLAQHTGKENLVLILQLVKMFPLHYIIVVLANGALIIGTCLWLFA